jgi:hypothetical protein
MNSKQNAPSNSPDSPTQPESRRSPDAHELFLRGLCGFVVGALLGLAFAPQVIPGALLAVGFAVAAARYGDRFWERLADWMRWWG